MKWLFAVAVALLPMAAPGRPPDQPRSSLSREPYYWHDGERQRQVWLAPRLVAEFQPDRGPSRPAGSVPASTRSAHVRIWRLHSPREPDQLAGALPSGVDPGQVSPVFRETPGGEGGLMALPGGVIVRLPPNWDHDRALNWARSQGVPLGGVVAGLPGTYRIPTDPGLVALRKAKALRKDPDVRAAFPDWWRQATRR